jgi:predicted nucleic acid-binding protein
MTILIDTNVLTRSLQPTSPHFPPAIAALRELNRRQQRMCIVPQVLYEFWAVCTRPPGENGLGMSTPNATAEQTKVISLFTFVPDSPAIFAEWQRLVAQYDVKGKNSHDARLVTAMTVGNIGGILTFNAADFARYPGDHCPFTRIVSRRSSTVNALPF